MNVFIAVSAVPIALFANITRVTMTCMTYYSFGSGAGKVIHDGSGWLMMPLALGLLWLELRFLDRLFIELEPRQPLSLSVGGVPRPNEL